MDRNQVLSEYWNLRKLLNQGNKLANERTVLVFTIESLSLSEFRLVASIKGEHEVRKIELVRRDRNGNWERSGYTNFKILENYCALILHERQEIKVNEFDMKEFGDFVQTRFEKLLMD